MRKATLRLLSLVVALTLVAGPAVARGKKETPTAPGKYSEWNGEIDELEVVEGFKLAEYSKVVVEPFDTKDTPLPPEKDNTYEPVKKVLVDPAGPFVEGLSEELKGKLAVSRGTAAGEAKTLVLKIKVYKMDPGSKAARYWGGFGAGAVRVGLRGELADAATGKVFVRFDQERRSGFGSFGGDYEDLMNRTLTQTGEDVASIVRAF